MIHLKDSTFIIPVKLESEHRIKNAKITLNFLNKFLDTNIIIYEFETRKVPDLIEITKNIRYIHEVSSGGKPFHRTKYLNEMLKLVRTPVTVNYDLDVILQPDVYQLAQDVILNQKYDFVYPYGEGDFQRKVHPDIKDKLIQAKLVIDLYDLMDAHSIGERAEFGHAQFVNTTSYIRGGMENEGFVSYGPEDKERHYRFLAMGYKMGRIDDGLVYHLEHIRTQDSSPENPHYDDCVVLYNKIAEMSVYELMEYYKQSNV